MILGVPVLSRYDLLQELFASAERGTVKPSEYLVVDNGGRFVPPAGYLGRKVSVQRPGRNIGVAAAWNRILRYAHGRGKPVAVSNDDVVFGLKTFEELAWAIRLPGIEMANALGWALFAQTLKCTEAVGMYDENFYPAYYEDCDYNYRMRLAGVARVDSATEPIFHAGSQTSVAMQDGLREHYEWYGRNRRYYVDKWGGAPGGERFRRPFDGRPPEGWTEQGVSPAGAESGAE